MRENGVEKFPDPNDGMMRMTEDIAEDPDFEKAQEACQKFMGGPGSSRATSREARSAPRPRPAR